MSVLDCAGIGMRHFPYSPLACSWPPITKQATGVPVIQRPRRDWTRVAGRSVVFAYVIEEPHVSSLRGMIACATRAQSEP